jgi:threonine dehydrogenase-like Zn-dependent dehydrogenase
MRPNRGRFVSGNPTASASGFTSQNAPARAGAAYVTFEPFPHDVQLDAQQLFFTHVRLHGGPAPVRRYLPQLIELISSGKIDPGKVFDQTLPIERVAEGYRTMDERSTVKTLLTV